MKANEYHDFYSVLKLFLIEARKLFHTLQMQIFWGRMEKRNYFKYTVGFIEMFDPFADLPDGIDESSIAFRINNVVRFFFIRINAVVLYFLTFFCQNIIICMTRNKT